MGIALLVWFVGLLWYAPAAWAINYYVAPPPLGNDSRSCDTAKSPSTPLETIGNARTCLGPGDTLFLRAGTYVESLIDGGFPGGSSWDLPVTFKNYSGEQAIWQATHGCAYPDTCRFPIYLRSASERWIIFDGIIFDGNNKQTNSPICNGDSTSPASQPAHIKFINIEVRNYISNMNVNRCADTSVINSSFHDNTQVITFELP